MDRDVEAAVAALLEQRGAAIRAEYEQQDLVVAYGDEECDSLDALAEELHGAEPDAAGTATYDALDTRLTGDAVYHEALHGAAFTSDRPAGEAVERMRMEADDRTSVGQGVDSGEGGLRFHVEEDPFLALWEDDDGVRYAAVQLVPEARSASCRRTRITYPGKVFAVTGVLDGVPDDAFTDEAYDALDDGAPAAGADVPGDEGVCPVGAELEQPPAPDRLEELPDEEDPDRGTMLAFVHSQFTEDGAFDRATYDGMLQEAAENLDHLGALANLLHDYLDETVRARYGDAEPDHGLLRGQIEDEMEALLEADAVGFEDGTSDLPTNFASAVRFTRDTVFYGVAPDSDAGERVDAWEETFREEEPATYTTLQRERRNWSILSIYLGDQDGRFPAPRRLVDPLLDGDTIDFDALDAFLAEEIPEEPEGTGFEGNETTRGMYQ